MKQLGYSKGYQYDHDAEGGVALGQTGFPDALGERVYYEPVESGLAIKLKEKLDRLRTQRARARDEAACSIVFLQTAPACMALRLQVDPCAQRRCARQPARAPSSTCPSLPHP